MADEKKTPPSEFSHFVREIGIRAFDKLSERVSERGTEPGASTFKASAATAVNKLAGYWATMTDAEKEKFFDQMISAAQLVAAGAPAMVASFGKKKETKEVKKKGKSASSIQDLEASILGSPRKRKTDKDKTKKKKKNDKDDKKAAKKS